MSILNKVQVPTNPQKAAVNATSAALKNFFADEEVRSKIRNQKAKVFAELNKLYKDGEVFKAYDSPSQVVTGGFVVSCDPTDSKNVYLVKLTGFARAFRERKPVTFRIIHSFYIGAESKSDFTVGNYVIIGGGARLYINDGNLITYNCIVGAAEIVITNDEFAKRYQLPENWYAQHLVNLAEQRNAQPAATDAATETIPY